MSSVGINRPTHSSSRDDTAREKLVTCPVHCTACTRPCDRYVHAATVADRLVPRSRRVHVSRSGYFAQAFGPLILMSSRLRGRSCGSECDALRRGDAYTRRPSPSSVVRAVAAHARAMTPDAEGMYRMIARDRHLCVADTATSSRFNRQAPRRDRGSTSRSQGALHVRWS